MSKFDNVINRRGTKSCKWDDEADNSLLPMWIADMDFKVPESVITDLKKRVDHGVFGYTVLSDDYKNAIKYWLKKRHGWEIKAEWVSYSPGIVPAINMIIKALTNPNDKVIIQGPVYYPFSESIKQNNRKIINNKLVLDDGKYRMNFDDLANKAADKNTKLLILCSPHNPVGRVWSEKELKKLGEICIKNDILVITDEIHSDLIYSGNEFTPFASISEDFLNNSITCISASKTFNLAGLQASGIIIKNKKIREQFVEKKIINSLMSPNIFGQEALISAYTKGEEWLEELLDYLESNLNYLNNFVEERLPEVNVIQPEGTYLVWMDFRKLNMNKDELEKFMLEEAKVWLDEGYIFGEEGIGFERMVIACPRKILKKGLTRIEKAINKIE